MTTKGKTRGRTGSGEEISPEDLVRALCHDVGNLLAAVRLSAHLLSTEISEAERSSLTRDVEDLAAVAGALLAQIRPLLSGATLARVRVSPAEVLLALTRALEERKPGGAALSIARGRGLPDVSVDPEALHHLLLTLVRGALEAAGPGGRVRVSAKREGRRVVVSVTDDGTPLDLDQPRCGRMPGGRELAFRVAEAVLRRMGGRATAELRRRGTCIALFLPARSPGKP